MFGFSDLLTELCWIQSLSKVQINYHYLYVHALCLRPIRVHFLTAAQHQSKDAGIAMNMLLFIIRRFENEMKTWKFKKEDLKKKTWFWNEKFQRHFSPKPMSKATSLLKVAKATAECPMLGMLGSIASVKKRHRSQNVDLFHRTPWDGRSISSAVQAGLLEAS